jgi:hypothetical protein
LIEAFRKLFNPQNYGHQEMILGGLSYVAGVTGKVIIDAYRLSYHKSQ